MQKSYLIVLAFSLLSIFREATAQLSWSQQMAQTVMRTWPDSFMLEGDKAPKWRYDQGVMLTGIERVFYATGQAKWFDYIRKCMDYYVQPNGTIKGYKPDEYNIDHLNNGRALLFLYEVTGEEKYKKAVQLLRNQLNTHPRTKEGSFWHKQIYPWQVWLDGLYMGQPFYAAFAQLFGEESAFDDIAAQFVRIEKHTRNAQNGLLYHGWDESRDQQWANKQTGTSPHAWGRALGWFGMAMVDVLDYFPENHSGRDSIISILNRFVTAISTVQDKQTGLWYDVVDMPAGNGNYFEASASSMLVYTIAKAVRKGYVSPAAMQVASKGYAGILKTFVKEKADQWNLHGTVSVSGLGGNPYRDGSFEYYISEKVVVNDPKGLGAFIQCAAEMEIAQSPKPGKGKKVVIDRFFNSERRKSNSGQQEYWHYVWNLKSHPGIYVWGNLFTRYGASLGTLDEAPNADNLRSASVYMIIDPDHVKDNPSPNYMNKTYATAIKDWVYAGGTLILMGNDSANCDLEHFNILSEMFGVHFTGISRNMVKNGKLEMGVVKSGVNEVFKQDLTMYLKEITTLEVTGPAKSIAVKEGETIMACGNFGKGKVFVVGDPWLYNEYLDGRLLPVEFQNFEAADMLTKWALQNKK